MSRSPVPALGPNERRLLLAGARTRLETVHKVEMTRLLSGSLDWHAILFHARLHSIASLLYSNLAALGQWDDVPSDARAHLLGLYHRTAYQNRIFASENGRILRAFGETGIPSIVPKGISLLELAYGDLSLRPLIDLVFLVPVDRVDEASGALRRAGYQRRAIRPIEAAWRWCCPQRAFSIELETAVTVLLHWQPLNWPRLHRFQAKDLWTDARPAQVSGQTAHVMSATDQILFLCLQADNHGIYNANELGSMTPDPLVFAHWSNNRLIRFVDIHEALRRGAEEIDWDELTRRARDRIVDDAVRTSLVMTDALLGPSLDPAVLERLRSQAERSADAGIARLVAPSRLTRPTGRLARLAARIWWRIPPRLHVELVYFARLAQYALPSRERWIRWGGPRGRIVTGPAYVGRAALVLSRSAAAFCARWTAASLIRLGWRLRAAAGTVVRSAVRRRVGREAATHG